MTKTWREAVSEKGEKKRYRERLQQDEEAQHEIDNWQPEPPLEFPDSDLTLRGVE